MQILDRDVQNFLANIKWLRQYYGYSKKKMSELLGIGNVSLNKIENGEMPPGLNVNVITNIQLFFGVSADKQFKLKLSDDTYGNCRKLYCKETAIKLKNYFFT